MLRVVGLFMFVVCFQLRDCVSSCLFHCFVVVVFLLFVDLLRVVCCLLVVGRLLFDGCFVVDC